MKISTIRPPLERDHEIYQAVLVEGLTQAVVARRFGLSQSSISKICVRVSQWLAINRPGRGLCLEHQIWLSLHNALLRAQHLRGLAAQVYHDSLKPGVMIITRTSKSGEVTEERRVTQPKANHQMYDRMCRWDEEIIDLTRREAEAEQVALKKSCDSGLLREDYFSRRCLVLCRTLLKTARMLRKNGVLVPPAPPLERRAIDQYVRAQTRDLPRADQPINFLPPEWQAYAKLLQCDSKLYRDSLQAQPGADKAPEQSPEPGVEKKESEIAEVSTNSTPIAREEVSETVTEETGCVASAVSEPAAPESPIQRNNSDESPVKQPARVFDPLSAALPPLRVTRQLPGMFTTESRRHGEEKEGNR